MNKQVILSALFATFAASAVTAATQDGRYDRPPGADNSKFAWADVLRVDPLYETVRTSLKLQKSDEQALARRKAKEAQKALESETKQSRKQQKTMKKKKK